MHDPELHTYSERLGGLLLQNRLMLVTAESCTGGALAEIITRIPGSSAWFERGFVTYSNASKQELLGVPAELIDTYGAVSEETALAMCKGALEMSHADVSVSVTGIAGPGGGTADKPVGLVCFATGNRKTKMYLSQKNLFEGDRIAVRTRACETALSLLITELRSGC